MSRIEFKQLCKRYAPSAPLTINNANLTIEKPNRTILIYYIKNMPRLPRPIAAKHNAS